MKQATIPLYIRFGEIPESKTSKVYRGDAGVRDEGGLSVWRAVKANGVYYPLLLDEPNESAISDFYYFLLESNTKVYLVTGTEMCIEGADREPLLMDVKILKDITHYYRNSRDKQTLEDGLFGEEEDICL